MNFELAKQNDSAMHSRRSSQSKGQPMMVEQTDEDFQGDI